MGQVSAAGLRPQFCSGSDSIWGKPFPSASVPGSLPERRFHRLRIVLGEEPLPYKNDLS